MHYPTLMMGLSQILIVFFLLIVSLDLEIEALGLFIGGLLILLGFGILTVIKATKLSKS